VVLLIAMLVLTVGSETAISDDPGNLRLSKPDRIRIHFASACPDAAPFRMLAGRLATAGP
jgi:hypothetical protein